LLLHRFTITLYFRWRIHATRKRRSFGVFATLNTGSTGNLKACGSPKQQLTPSHWRYLHSTGLSSPFSHRDRQRLSGGLARRSGLRLTLTPLIHAVLISVSCLRETPSFYSSTMAISHKALRLTAC